MKATTKDTFQPILITIDSQVELDVLLDALMVYANDRRAEMKMPQAPLFEDTPNKEISFALGAQISQELVACIIRALGGKYRGYELFSTRRDEHPYDRPL